MDPTAVLSQNPNQIQNQNQIQNKEVTNFNQQRKRGRGKLQNMSCLEQASMDEALKNVSISSYF